MMSIKSLSFFELLKFIARLNGQIHFNYKAFPSSYLPDGVYNSTSTRVVNIEVVTI